MNQLDPILFALLQAANIQVAQAQSVAVFVQRFVQSQANLPDGASVNIQTGEISVPHMEEVKNESV